VLPDDPLSLVDMAPAEPPWINEKKEFLPQKKVPKRCLSANLYILTRLSLFAG
jgi:hypothetical protein